MTIEKKLLGTSPSGGAANVADVFSTYLWKGNGGSQTITNGIDLAGEGGMVWIKNRTSSSTHSVHDTERGVHNRLRPDTTNASGSQDPYGVSAFNSNGFSYGSGGHNNNQTGQDYVSWTFRNSKKFFKAVTFSYGGSSSSPTIVTHDLGCTVGMTFVKQTNGTQNWYVQHKNVTGNDNNGALNLTIAFAGGNGQSTSFTSITDTQATFGAAASFPAGTYVAYFFADNSSEDAEDQMIKCGSYTGNNAVIGPVVNLGWEPQFVLIKSTQGSDAWVMFDSMRGLPEGTGNASSKRILSPNSSSGEGGTNSGISVDPTGFHVTGVGGQTNDNNYQYIYMAIRGPMMVEPEAATEVFAMYSGGTSQSYPQYLSGFPVDMALHRATTSTNSELATRLLGAGLLKTNATDAWGASGAYAFDYSNGWFTHGSPTYFTNYKSWMWKRAKGFMDVVAYTGSSSAGNLTINHSLGVAPELIISKSRSNAQAWSVLFNMGASSYQYFTTLGTAPDYGSGRSYGSGYLASKPTDTAYAIKTDTGIGSGNNYIAYLFATLAGISKVGSYTGNGSNQTINCGFSAGSRFILIKRVNNSGDWYFWDSVRGIVAGNDPHLSLNTSAAQVTSDDSVDPHNSGFIVNQVSATNINVSSEEYLFYAIA